MRTNPPKPRLRTEHFNVQYPYSEFSKKQINAIFDDDNELKQEFENRDSGQTNAGTQNVDGWSFVKMTQSHLEIYENMNQEGGEAKGGQRSPKGQFSVAGNTQNEH